MKKIRPPDLCFTSLKKCRSNRSHSIGRNQPECRAKSVDSWDSVADGLQVKLSGHRQEDVPIEVDGGVVLKPISSAYFNKVEKLGSPTMEEHSLLSLQANSLCWGCKQRLWNWAWCYCYKDLFKGIDFGVIWATASALVYGKFSGCYQQMGT